MSYNPTCQQLPQLDSRGNGGVYLNRKMAIFNKFISPKYVKWTKLPKIYMISC